MLWLDGSQLGVWLLPGGSSPLTFHLPGTKHVVMRQRMTDEMMIEDLDQTSGIACTYYSLRRTVRALVNNRIAGGRLNFDRAHSSPATRKLLDDIFTASSHGANAAILANNAPRTNVQSPADIHAAAMTLIPILESFFPAPAPVQVINGTTSPVNAITQGRLFYDLWQSAVERFEDPQLARNYPADHIGRGAPGALVALGLAAGYHVSGDRNPGETDADYWDRLVRGLLSGLVPGALIQLWNLESDFKIIKQRQWLTTQAHSYGHSPVFHSVSQGGTGPLWVIDQQGKTECQVIDTGGKFQLGWGGVDPEEVWVAANWTE
jgi:hypothetical protein